MTARPGLSADVLDDLDWWTRPVAERDALFAWLRANNPRPFAPQLDLSGNPRGGGFWALTRMDDIREVSRRPDDFCSGHGINIFDQPPGLKDYRGSFIDMDNPEHARLRRIVSRGFAATSLDAVREDVDRAAREIIGGGGAKENLTPDELAAFFILLVGAGNETTRNAISHGLLALTEFPVQRALWQG